MIVLGVILVIAAVVVGADMVFKDNFQIPEPHILGEATGLHHGAAFYMIGVIVGAAIMLGIALLVAGLGRKGSSAATRRRQRRAGAQAGAERDELIAENQRLRQALAERPVTAESPAAGASVLPTTADAPRA